MGKAVARSSHKTIAVECMKNKASCNHAIAIISSTIHKEIRTIASTNTQSILHCKSKDSIKNFEWRNLQMEFTKYAPVLFRILTAATKTRVHRPNQFTVIGMCFAMILKHRNPKLNLLQKIVSLILYSGHSSKEVSQGAIHAVIAILLLHAGLPAVAAIKCDYVLFFSTSINKSSGKRS